MRTQQFTTTLILLLLVLLLVSAPTLATATPAATERPSDLTDATEVEAWFDGTMADQMDRHDVPGATVVLVANDTVVLAKGYGYADVAAERPVVANETVFHIGSTGKLLTWTAVMQGVEDGRLDLDRDVDDYLTESAVTIPDTYPESITLEHLGTHSAGFEDSLVGMLADDPDEVRPLEKLLVDHQPARVRPPGEFVAYSNYGTALAGHVVAEQYDTTFTAYVDEQIFTPLEMDDTTYEQPLPADLEARSAVGYASQNGAYQPQPGKVWTMAPQGGSLKSTGTDMGRFMLAHLNGGEYGGVRILDAETVREMHQRHFTKAPAVPELNGMAYGFIEMDRNDERIVGHWGDTTYFKSMLALFPERDAGLFVVYNSPGGAAARFELLEAFVDRYYPTPASPVGEPPAGAAERAAKVTGDYRSLTVSETTWERVLGVMTRTYTVSATDDGHLTTERLGTAPETWVEREPGVYRAVDGDETLVFLLDEEGRGTHMFRGNFAPATYERVPWDQSQVVLRGVVGGGLLAFVSMLVLLPGGAVWRRVRDRPAPTTRERLARWLLGVTSLLWLAVVVIFLLVWINFNAEVASPSLALRVGTVLPYVALAGTVGAVVATGLAWHDDYWGLAGRLHYSLVTVAAVLVAWQLSYLRILPL